jgi:hypothetical protein
MVVVPAALQFQVGDVAKFAVHCVTSTLTDGGSTEPPLNSHALPTLPSQSSVPAPHGAHEPLEQVWLVVHATVEQDVPQLESVAVSFSQPLPMVPSQLSLPAGQFTHAPPVHVCVFAVHATVEPQVPLEEHVCTPLPEHWCVPGTQTPVHAPLTHADETHAVLLPQAPLDEHVSTLFPLQWVAPGAQTPVQTPPTHA